MNQIFCLILLVATANCYYIETGTSAPKDKIIGGEAVNILDVPYVAQLMKNNSQHCGASILSKYWLLTAAHCIIKIDTLSIITGSTYTTQDGTNHEIDEIIVHESFSLPSYNHDIALIKLKGPIKISDTRRPIEIAKQAPKTGDKLRISGYGRVIVQLKRSSPVLRSAVVPVIDFKVCLEQYSERYATENMFCAGVGNVDACSGDSGGPAVVNNKLVGVISNGSGCASKKYSGIYTKVVNYLDWIKEHSGLTY